MLDYFRSKLLPPCLLCLSLHLLILVYYLLLDIAILSDLINHYPDGIPLCALIPRSGALERGVLKVLYLDARPRRSIAILHQYN